MSEKYLKMFEAFSGALAKKISFEIKYKNESWLMKLLGKILFFNSKFMTGFVTTIGNVVYFPNREYIAERETLGALEVLSHEARHIRDLEQVGKLPFTLSYMFPQILAPLALFGLLINWWVAVIALVVFLLPWPAPWRKHWELRGYIMSLFFSNEAMKEAGLSQEERATRLAKAAEYYNDNFTNLSYYLMWPFGVKEELAKASEKILSGEIIKEDVIYDEVVSALRESKSL